MNKHEILSQVTFGHRIAEEETDVLSTYFVETDHWKRLYRGDIDVVYGPKGSGKSALYSLLLAKSGDLFDKGIILIADENPRGATAFRDLATDPPASEREFVGLWKLYIASLLHAALAEYSINNEPREKLESALVAEGLVKGTSSLASLLRAVVEYARRAFCPQAVEGKVTIDPVTQMPNGFGGRITFSEPGKSANGSEFRSVDVLLELANESLALAGIQTWVLLDRLDVAFADNSDLESNALRALFRVYLDLASLSRVKLKIFLRTDIWDRITTEGFREASHITRHVTISWNRNSLLNLVVRRSIHNQSIQSFYQVSEDLPRQEWRRKRHSFTASVPTKSKLGRISRIRLTGYCHEREMAQSRTHRAS